MKSTEGQWDDLIKHMAKNGWTQCDIAAVCEVGQASVSYWMSGKRFPSQKHRELLVSYFKMPRSQVSLRAASHARAISELRKARKTHKKKP